MTQKEFAGLLGITAIHYCAIENGRKEVTIKLLKKVAEITKMQLVITLIDK
jgi:transcriptional regulator with XRE-family HTH domain